MPQPTVNTYESLSMRRVEWRYLELWYGPAALGQRTARPLAAVGATQRDVGELGCALVLASSRHSGGDRTAMGVQHAWSRARLERSPAGERQHCIRCPRVAPSRHRW